MAGTQVLRQRVLNISNTSEVKKIYSFLTKFSRREDILKTAEIFLPPSSLICGSMQMKCDVLLI
jgi:hypothetical protein